MIAGSGRSCRLSWKDIDLTAARFSDGIGSMNFNERQIPPPKYWQQFEDLCLSLFRNIWGDPTAQKNGRSGQTQHGTDVWGGADYDRGALHGVQCKGKDIGLGAAVTENGSRSEVEKAKQFTPSYRIGFWRQQRQRMQISRLSREKLRRAIRLTAFSRYRSLDGKTFSR